MARGLDLAYRPLGLPADDCRRLATLGGFLILAARNPLENLSLIWFTVWSSVVHAAIMLAQSFEGPQNHGHLLGDVPALIFVAVLLGVLTPRGAEAHPVG